MALLCVLIFWRMQVATQDEKVLSLSRGVAAGVRSEILGRLHRISESLRFLSVRATSYRRDEVRAWGAEARFVMERFPSLLWVEWIGPGVGPGRRIGRSDLSEAILGEPRVAVEGFAEMNGTLVSEPFRIGDGRWAFRVEVPQATEKIWLTGTFALEDFLEQTLTAEERRNYVAVEGSSGISYATREPTPEAPLLRRQLFAGDSAAGWTIAVGPSSRALSSARSALPLVALVLGLAITALLTLLTRSLGLERQRTEELAALNADLENRIRARTMELAEANRLLAEDNAHRGRVQSHLARVNESLRQFDAFVSHELRRPLAGIGAWLDLLASSPALQGREREGRYVARARAEIGRMARLIDKELVLARAAEGDLPTSPVELTPLAREVIAEVSGQGIREEAPIEIGELPIVLGDRDQLKQLISNLIENALKYRREGVPPVIRIESIRASEEDEWHEILVRDNGRGLDPATADRLFDAFQREQDDGVEGSGIGLAVCRRIVENHGGSIWAEGRPGLGSVIHVKLPAVREEDATSPSDRPRLAGS